MGGIANGFAQLFKAGRRSIGNAIDNFWLNADAKKAIEDEVINKFKGSLSRVQTVKDAKAANIKELDDKYKASIDELQKKQDTWNTNYNSARDSKKQEMDKALADWNRQGSDINSNLTQAKKERDDYINNYMSDLNYDNTVFIDTSGNSFIIDPINNFKKVPVNTKWLNKHKSYDTKFIGNDGKLVNLFDDNSVDSFTKALGPNSQVLNYIISKKNSLRNTKEYKQLDDAVQKLETDDAQYKAASTPEQFDEIKFKREYQKTNGNMPNSYEFNGLSYNKTGLDSAHDSAIKLLKDRSKDLNKRYSALESKRDAEIAKRIQDAKDIKKAKLALGAGALAAGAAAMYGGDDTDNGDTPDNIDSTDNTYTGEPDPNINIEKEGQAILKDRQAGLNGMQQIDTDFDPDKAAAVAALSQGAYDKGVEDGNAIGASDIVTADGQPIEDGLFELLKAMKDPYKADAIANYIYSRHGNDPEVRRRGWRAWLDRNYGDPLRSKMNIDPSGYKGMHISGGL